MPREPFGMFYVVVDPNSTFEKLLAIATMAPYFIVCALVTLIVRCRELLTATWLAGQLLNEVANFLLKRIFKQKRPDGAPGVGFDVHGMPSDHSQFMGFFLAFGVLVLVHRIRIPNIVKIALASLSAGLVIAVCLSRTELGFHTPEQVIAGVFFGAMFGCIWFLFSSVCLFPHFPRISGSSLGRLLMLRDGSRISNVLAFEDEAYLKAQSQSITAKHR